MTADPATCPEADYHGVTFRRCGNCGWTEPAATPGRDELRPIIREAVDRWHASTSAYYASSTEDWRNGLSGYVASAVDTWVAAHTDEDWSRLWAEERDGRTRAEAAVARVRALCDEAERMGGIAHAGGLLSSGRVRAALDQPTEGP